MIRQHLFAFGSNPFGKCCPGTSNIIVRTPVDILPSLLQGHDCMIDEVEVVSGTWDRTLIRLREKSTGSSRYYAMGFQEDAPERLNARPVQADEIDNFFDLEGIHSDIDAHALPTASQLTLLESGSVVGTTTCPKGSSGIPGCIYAETSNHLQRDPASCLHPLPGRPGTAYQVATGLSHAILLFQSPNPSFNTMLGIGDNRHRAALPSTEDCRQPMNNLLRPAMIEALCGVEILGISAGGYRSAAWTKDGEGWIWGKGIEGLSSLELPDPEELEDNEDEGKRIAQVAVGDDYEFVLSSDGVLWARGENNLGQLGISSDTEPSDFVAHPFFAAPEGGCLGPTYRVRSVACKRSSTFVFCDSFDP